MQRPTPRIKKKTERMDSEGCLLHTTLFKQLNRFYLRKWEKHSHKESPSGLGNQFSPRMKDRCDVISHWRDQKGDC